MAHLINLSVSAVRQDGVVNGSWHLLYVPDQSLLVICWNGRERGYVLSR